MFLFINYLDEFPSPSGRSLVDQPLLLYTISQFIVYFMSITRVLLDLPPSYLLKWEDKCSFVGAKADTGRVNQRVNLLHYSTLSGVHKIRLYQIKEKEESKEQGCL